MSGISMGCKVSLPCLRFMEGGKEEEEQEEPRQYSWDLARQTLDLSQFTIDRSILANGCEMYTYMQMLNIAANWSLF